MLTSLWITAALAGNADINVEIEGDVTRHVFVDGKLQGAAKDGKKVSVTVPQGKHEVAVAHDKSANWLLCIGEVDVRKDVTITARNGICSSLDKGAVRSENTVRNGSLVIVTGAGAKGDVEIADQRIVAQPGLAIKANLKPGTHTVNGPHCSGKITVKQDEQTSIIFADETCVGLDAGGGKKKKKK